MSNPILRVEDVSKQFGAVTAVDAVSLDMAVGEILCLLGPSGCGKTTLLRLVAGLETPNAGRILFDGRDISGVPAYKRGFGMMFQDFALFPHMNVAENIGYGLQGQPNRLQRITEMLELVDLAGYGERQIDQLSGGQQQRVALARALATSPRLLMLDEPLGALDRALRERLMLELRAILKRVGVTAIYVTHDQAEAYAVSDRMAVMRAGVIEQIDTPRRVYARPNSPFVARFLGFSNIINGQHVGDGWFETPIGRLFVGEEVEGESELLIRPNAIQTDAATTYDATLVAASFRGRYTELHFDVSGTRLEFEVEDGEWVAGNRYSIGIDSAKIVPL